MWMATKALYIYAILEQIFEHLALFAYVTSLHFRLLVSGIHFCSYHIFQWKTTQEFFNDIF